MRSSTVYAQSPWDRSPTNGFRCVRYTGVEENLARLTRDINRPFRDYFNEEPVSDETFEIYLSQFAYDRTDLGANVESETKYDDWIHQRIALDAAYGNERMTAHLFLPTTGNPPYQTVVYFPGSDAISTRSSENYLTRERVASRIGFLPKSGRAVMFPVLKGTLERGDDLASDLPAETSLYKDHVIMWIKDLSRSIDYLETRDDIDTDKLAYYGLNWGGAMGAMVPAVEKRIKTCVLCVAGLDFRKTLPEVDAINYITRVTQPVLMLNGQYDFFFPMETSQRPMFELLGTPVNDKSWRTYEGSHSVPQSELIRETLDWLDTYLGPVE